VLNEFQRTRAWEGLLSAETRSLYFDDLAARYSRQKQWITGVSFFFSSGAAATIIAKFPSWVPLVLALTVAGATAYSIALNLDRRIATMAKLHSAWARIAGEYNHLWSHTSDQDAESELDRILGTEREPSELATTEAPYDEKLMAHWQERVFAMYRVPIEKPA
jgi:hypothetical protein